MPEKRQKEEVKPALIAFAPFDFLGTHYEIGDPFTPPEGWQHDAAFDTTVQIGRRRTGNKGMTYTRDGRRYTLPVKES